MSRSKSINGRESSILALLAQCSQMPEEEGNRIADSVTGSVRRIGYAILGRPLRRTTKAEFIAAKGFLDWANELGNRD